MHTESSKTKTIVEIASFIRQQEAWPRIAAVDQALVEQALSGRLPVQRIRFLLDLNKRVKNGGPFRRILYFTPVGWRLRWKTLKAE